MPLCPGCIPWLKVGFDEAKLNDPVSELSTGWRTSRKMNIWRFPEIGHNRAMYP